MANKKRIALVTGANGGIGTAICRSLADQGIQVIGNYIDKSSIEHWKKEQQDNNYHIETIFGDVSNFDASKEMIQQAETTIGLIDILINVAGITEDSTLKKMTSEQWKKVISIDLDSVFNVTRHVIPGMLERGFGRIISISSVNAQKGNFGQTNYCAAKAGICGFSKALALEVAGKGITVNTVSPGYVNTPMVQKIPPEILNKIIAQIPVGRLAESTEIARVVSFLASDESGYITGANIAINGGIYSD